MTFNLRLSLANFDVSKPNRNCILIADTILINGETTEIMTKSVPKNYPDISY